MTNLIALLDVQAHDTQLDQLRHEHSSTPERAQAASAETQLADCRAQLAAARQERDAVAAAEKRLDDEAASIEARAAEAEKKLYSGTITSPKELQALQADVDALRAHRSQVEDRELEIMETREAHDATVQQLELAHAVLATTFADLCGQRDARLRELDQQITEVLDQRSSISTGVPASLLAEYERRRVAARGIGIARLVAGTCQGCRLSIPATEVDRMRHDQSDTLHFCDNCGCILVVGG
ncbi:MAG: zinc ribbon domain-containing protein [Acidimicrobiia bacterium]